MTQREYQTHLLWPTLCFLLTLLIITWLSLDKWLADLVFQWGHDVWVMRDNWLTKTIIHEGGRKLVGAMLIILLLIIGLAHLNTTGKKYRAGLWYVLAAALLSGILINLLKEVTGMDCPWDLTWYGGNKIYHGMLDFTYPIQDPGRCFPAGHASAAYAWFGIYFFVRRHFPSFQGLAIGTVILLGLVFGVAQQFRGAHFLSHDLWTAWICWMVAASMYYLAAEPLTVKHHPISNN